MPVQLYALTEGSSILVDKPILLFGRDMECDIRLDSRKISRRHCCLAQVGDHLVIKDLESTNGVRINGVRVSEGKLTSGDELTIGNHRYQVRWDVSPRMHKSSIKKEAKKKSRNADKRPFREPVVDEILESSEEPIPLKENLDGARVPSVYRAKGAVPPNKPPSSFNEMLPDAEADDDIPTPNKAPCSAEEPEKPRDLPRERSCPEDRPKGIDGHSSSESFASNK